MLQNGAGLDTGRQVVRSLPRRHSRLEASDQRIYLFIYRVRHRARPPDSHDERFCTVLVLGRSANAAEGIAINCVHQHGWHIVKTDTAAVLRPAELEVGDDGAIYQSDLEAFGASFRLLARA